MKLVVLVCALFAVANFAASSCYKTAHSIRKPGFGPGEQDWGYATVRPNAHMFWWLYYTTANVADFTEKPLVIWLQGGPGASSTGYGNFAELGPLDLHQNERNFTWVKDANVLFLDNPVGTGYSYTDTSAALTTTNRQIAEDLVEMMRQFYEHIPEFKTVPLVITAESYGGKMAAEFALLLDEAIKAGTIESNLVGVGLGDSWVSPIDSVMTWAPFLLQVGAVDQAGHDAIMAAAKDCQDALNAGQFEQATDLWGYTEMVIWQVAANVDFYNILKKIPSSGKSRSLVKPAVREDEDALLEELMNGAVKEALGINVTWGAQSSQVFSTLSGDFMKPATKIVEQLLDTTDIKVAVFSGQLDLIVDTPGTVIWVDNLTWSGSAEWARADRDALAVGGYNEGYVKKTKNLSLYWVNRAGHMVPADNPYAMDAILRYLTNDYSGKKN